MSFSKERKDGTFLKLFEFVFYVIFILLGFYLAFLIRFEMNPSSVNIQPFYQNMPYIIVTSIIIFYIYDIVLTAKKSLYENALTIAISVFLIDIMTVAIVFFNRGFAFPRSVFIVGFFIQFILIFFLKITVLNIIKRNRKSQNILLVVSNKESNLITKEFLLNKTENDCIKYICNLINQETYKLIDEVDKVYIDSNIPNKDKLDLIEYCSKKNKILYLVPGMLEIALINSKITQSNDMLLLKVERFGLSFEQKVLKRVLDIVISIIGLIITLPLLLIVSIIIKLYDKGPVFYKQERVTENNKIFNLYKFRTMIVDAEKYTGPVLATERDPRITPIGRFLRATRIDELPQLINVLKGDMSIVGPRPERPYFVEKFNKEIEEFKYRVFVKAGITGLAQVLGRYSTDPENKAKFDLLYIKNYSLLLDIKIIFNTFKVIFMKDSSAGVKEDEKVGDILEKFNLSVYEEVVATKEE
ncbi:exopolysaccharide biosynthesis polyprenyl glycosylphosphotransferase [Caminicella sporogenes DSM 14501]|uniref:Exopolysaccharide biosynthesis polyprenyl glycosylphosphotransferase n=1 Tax=Caminicella sporogenes DSM 14501 TaxID=1121266 RepID=A0A1M6PVT5_9FIRM|nr:sugar transferase [Caminicella sporogenes]RKD21952.1 sugar transferase [Caminicella sporogenes]SHK12022.1 exopolysaccharide biosynthesis polyprenyl glycosylphosphotransferase [Caminicella sporogenes DSM 14501]